MPRFEIIIERTTSESASFILTAESADDLPDNKKLEQLAEDNDTLDWDIEDTSFDFVDCVELSE